jgi:outer membrane PBP1 activator LpoA protein
MINPEEKLQHHTGLLSVDNAGRVKRSLLMATYENGRAKLLQTPDTMNLTPGALP